jgi:hypothetical protein
MDTRIIAIALAVGLAGCSTNERQADLIVTKVVGGKFTAATAPATGGTCGYSASDDEQLLPTFDGTAPNNRAATGFVVDNQMVDTSTLNSQLRTNTNTFTPHQAVVDYEFPGAAVAQQIVPVSSGTVATGSQTVVLVELFSPTAALAAANAIAAPTFVRTTTRIEGKLDDGTTVSTSAHEYVINVCPGCGNSVCF